MSRRSKWGGTKSAAIAAQAQGLTAQAASRAFGVKVNSVYRAAVRCGFRFVPAAVKPQHNDARRPI